MAEKHLEITRFNNGWVHVVSHDHKWDEIMLNVEEQKELLNYLLTHLTTPGVNEARSNEINRMLAVIQKDIEKFNDDMKEKIEMLRVKA